MATYKQIISLKNKVDTHTYINYLEKIIQILLKHEKNIHKINKELHKGLK